MHALSFSNVRTLVIYALFGVDAGVRNSGGGGGGGGDGGGGGGMKNNKKRIVYAGPTYCLCGSYYNDAAGTSRAFPLYRAFHRSRSPRTYEFPPRPALPSEDPG